MYLKNYSKRHYDINQYVCVTSYNCNLYPDNDEFIVIDNIYVLLLTDIEKLKPFDHLSTLTLQSLTIQASLK